MLPKSTYRTSESVKRQKRGGTCRLVEDEEKKKMSFSYEPDMQVVLERGLYELQLRRSRNPLHRVAGGVPTRPRGT